MKREFDFIKNLDTKDVGYVLQKKQEHHARVIQRGVRRFLARRRQREKQAGISLVDSSEEVETEAERKRREANERYYRETSEYVLSKHKDTFKAKISDERRLELIREVTAKRNEQSEQDIRNLRCEAIDDAYRKKFSEYQQEEQTAERQRISALQNLY